MKRGVKFLAAFSMVPLAARGLRFLLNKRRQSTALVTTKVCNIRSSVSQRRGNKTTGLTWKLC